MPPRYSGSAAGSVKGGWHPQEAPEAVNVAHALERAARYFPDKPAILFEDRCLSYRDLEAAASRTAHGLAAWRASVGRSRRPLPAQHPGLRDRLRGDPEARRHRGVRQRHPDHRGDRLPAGGLRSERGLHRGGSLVAAGAARRRRAAARPRGDLRGRGGRPGHPRRRSAPAGPERLPACDLDPAAPAAILYTSGTTGRQKGATLSHGNILSNLFAVNRYMHMGPADRLLVTLPLFHVAAQNVLMNAGFNAASTRRPAPSLRGGRGARPPSRSTGSPS